jgi:hypothetical protein
LTLLIGHVVMPDVTTTVQYRQVLREIFKRHNCAPFMKYPDSNWPPCCSECGCEIEARRRLAEPDPAEPPAKAKRWF